MLMHDCHVNVVQVLCACNVWMYDYRVVLSECHVHVMWVSCDMGASCTFHLTYMYLTSHDSYMHHVMVI